MFGAQILVVDCCDTQAGAQYIGAQRHTNWCTLVHRDTQPDGAQHIPGWLTAVTHKQQPLSPPIANSSLPAQLNFTTATTTTTSTTTTTTTITNSSLLPAQ